MPDVSAREQLKPERCTSACTPVWGEMSFGCEPATGLCRLGWFPPHFYLFLFGRTELLLLQCSQAVLLQHVGPAP